MESEPVAPVLVVAHKTAATPALLDAVRQRAQRGPCYFHLVVPSPGPRDGEDGRQVLALALPLLEEAAHRPVTGLVSPRHDPMDAVEETASIGS